MFETSKTLEKLLSHQRLGQTELEGLFHLILDENCPPAIIAALLVALRISGESGNELFQGAKELRQRARKVPFLDRRIPIVDNCGTGGDGSHSFNISTTAAIVASSVGVRVAKAGNRSVSSKCGSADLLFACGFPENFTPEQSARLLGDTGLTFFYAPSFHPSLKHIGPIRRSLGIRTIFNYLGPLANPLNPDFQLIGVGTKALMKPMADACAQLGIKKYLVVHSHDGLDEISHSAATDVIVGTNGTQEVDVIRPEQFGIFGQQEDILGGDPDANRQLLEGLLEGGNQKLSDAVCLNAGAIIWLSGIAADHKAGVKLAQSAVGSGKTRDFFDDWIRKAQELSKN